MNDKWVDIYKAIDQCNFTKQAMQHNGSYDNDNNNNDDNDDDYVFTKVYCVLFALLQWKETTITIRESAIIDQIGWYDDEDWVK